MSSCRQGALWGFLLLTGGVVFGAGASIEEFAPEKVQGILEVEVKVEGIIILNPEIYF